MVGGGSRQTRPPQYNRPGGPAIAFHQLIHHNVHNDMSRRRAHLCTHLRRGARNLDPPLRLKGGNLPEDGGSLSPSAIRDLAKVQNECTRWVGEPMSFQLSRPKNSRGGRQSSWRGDEFLPRVEALSSTAWRAALESLPSSSRPPIVETTAD